MAIKLSGNTVIDDNFQLLGITNTDITTDTTINSSIKFQDNVLRIFDSTGTEVRTLYAAAETART
jgi:hypothetical protein